VLGQLLEIHEGKHGTNPKRFQLSYKSATAICCIAQRKSKKYLTIAEIIGIADALKALWEKQQ
jgi:hypothetical protein